MTPPILLRQLARELRGQGLRLGFFAACLGIGVAAVVAVAGLSDALQEGIRARSRELLAADLAVEGYRPPPDEVVALLAAQPATRTTTVRETVTMVTAPDATTDLKSQLSEVKVVGAGYPFYGRVETRPDRPLAQLLAPDTVIVDPDLLLRFGLRTGATVTIGGQPFEVVAELVSEPDRLGGAFTLGPRLLLSPEGLERAGIATFGSRVRYRLLIRLPDGTTAQQTQVLSAAVHAALESAGVAAYYDVESWSDARPALRRGIDRVHRFLGLLALVSLLIGGVGISQAIRAWLARRLDAIAIRKCLGARPREIVLLYLAQSSVLGLGGSLGGAILGIAVTWWVPRMLRDVLPIPLEAIRVFQPEALLRGVGLGVAVATVFALPPLLAIRQIPPARVLRRNAEPLREGRRYHVAAGAILLLAVWATAWIQSASLRLGSLFALGLVAATAILAGSAYLVARGAGRVPRSRLPFGLRFGLSALGRPGAGTVGSVVALGLGVLVVLGTLVVERHLSRQLRSELPEDAPTAFMVEILPDQWPPLRELLVEEGATRIDSVPVVMARLTAIGGRSVSELAEARTEGEEGDRRWALTREQRLTWMEALPPDNEVVEGRLWSDPERAEVSVEADFAHDIGATLGTVLTFDLQGVPLELTVTSLRSVDWRSFGINFFFVVEPGVLERAPYVRLAAARLPAEREITIQNRVAQAFPNVTLVLTRQVLERIANILSRLGLGVRFLGSFTVLAGLVILAGAVGAGAARRGREVALLKTLGWTRPGVVGILATEYALVGLLVGVLGTVGGLLLGWAVVTEGFEMPWDPDLWLPAVAVATSVVLVVSAGLLASLRPLRQRPLQALRQEG